MHSFENTLRAVCRDIKPKRILEWGPGRSTVVMHQECPDAQIVTTEHNPEYFKIATENYGSFAAVFRYRADGQKCEYAVWPIWGMEDGYKADLAFIDGRRRVECAMVAGMMVRSGGVIVVHDAHRWHYREVLEHWLGKPEEKYLADSMTRVWIIK